jgi:pyroglutamyl-peptidase
MGRKVFITGFGRFCGIEDNPTTHLVEWLAQSDVLAGHAILTVAVSDVTRWFDENESRLREENPLLLHLGVDGGSQEFALETTAYNTIDFPCPDERNFQPPEPTPIDPLAPLDGQLFTTCSDILSVQEHLTTLGLNCHVSTDPGRFLCNFIYYQALSRGYHALFCHVPPFSAISEIEQRDFLVHLISLLSAENI